MYSTIQVLIPTFKKTKEDIVSLFSFWKLESDCIVSNQCGRVGEETLEYNGHTVKIIYSDTIGVSKNRNILLNALSANLGVFIDDDCSLVDNYAQNILDEMNKYKADAALFTGYNDKGGIINTAPKTKVCTKYSHISHMGGPGICVSKVFIEKTNLSFNEKLGTPNRIYMGEDSFFGYELMKKKPVAINSNVLVFKVVNDIDNSSYFVGYNEQFFFSKGAINKLVHPKSYKIWKLHYIRGLKKKTHQKTSFILRNMKKGEKAIKKGRIIA